MEQDYTLQVMEAYQAASKNTLADRMGITIVEASAERVVGTMPVAGNIQPYGLLHGGASCVLAETLGSLASALHAGPDRITVGVEINATHHRAATDGPGDRRDDSAVRRADHHHARDRHHQRSRAAGSAPRGSPACSWTGFRGRAPGSAPGSGPA